METFLKKQLEDDGFIVQEPVSQVIVVEDFLSKDELDSLHNIINNLSEDDWMIEYTKKIWNIYRQIKLDKIRYCKLSMEPTSRPVFDNVSLQQ
jgi:hypothetical protein